MRSLPALFGIALLSIGIAACGGATQVTGSAPQTSSAKAVASVPVKTTDDTSTATSTISGVTSPHGYRNDGDEDIVGDADNDNNHDNDNDNSEDHKPDENGYYHDGDDREALAFGQPASAADAHAIAAAVKRYFTLAAAGDAARACSMLVPTLAKATAEDYGQGSAGPAYLRLAKNCPTVLGLLFGHFHARLTVRANITGIRVNGDQALVLLGSPSLPASEIALSRENGVWRIDNLLGGPLP